MQNSTIIGTNIKTNVFTQKAQKDRKVLVEGNTEN